MSYSLEFCKKVVSDPLRSNYTDRDFRNAKEFKDTELFFDKALLHGRRKLHLEHNKDEKYYVDAEFTFNSDAEFDYFTSSASIHDGTLMFEYKTMCECVVNICCCATRYKKYADVEWGDKVKYTIGNFVILNEYDGTFCKDKDPWKRQRTTVLVPLKMEIEKSNLGIGVASWNEQLETV